ncbi:cfem domain-containing protein [Diplodia corticola]|uniref:Cfem domain-containing protein n=1 Tax=Diplodia corticola TaxID=236234 RepID=A0A1J9S012_9PEZI|nr:cfem domain-containing protein [Diplodia corticola]OJD33364.1 cfem domain-containing protein [Diplodia corticola]
MKFSTAVVLAASASMAAAYTQADIPKCAIPCIQAGAPKVGCEVKDAACQCKKQDDLAAEVIGCISEKCTAEEAMESSKVSASICEDLNSGKTSNTGVVASSSGSSNSSSNAVSTPSSDSGSASTPSSTPSATPSSTNAAGVLQAGGFAAGLSAAMGAVMLAL